MASLFQFSENEILQFALVLIRLSAFFMIWPLLGIETVPAPLKILFSLVVTMMVYPVIKTRLPNIGTHESQLAFMSLREAFIGFTFGLLSRGFLNALKMAGELISTSIGLSSAQLYNPAMGSTSTPMDQLLFMLTGLVYLSIQGHHLFLVGAVDTFRVLPPGVLGFEARTFLQFTSIMSDLVIAGIRMSAPAVAAIFVVNVVMGVLGKTVPQINVLTTSLAVNLAVGLVVLFLALPSMLEEVPDILEQSAERVFQLVKAL